MVDGDGYRFEKVVDAGRRVKRGIESFFNRMAGEEGCRTFLSETGKPCSTFFRASALKSRDSDIFPVASIHFDYRHFQLFYSLLIKTGGEEDVRGFARIHCSCILSIDISICTRISKKRRKIESIHFFRSYHYCSLVRFANFQMKIRSRIWTSGRRRAAKLFPISYIFSIYDWNKGESITCVYLPTYESFRWINRGGIIARNGWHESREKKNGWRLKSAKMGAN